MTVYKKKMENIASLSSIVNLTCGTIHNVIATAKILVCKSKRLFKVGMFDLQQEPMK